jgi:fatty acid amide hydrolase
MPGFVREPLLWLLNRSGREREGQLLAAARRLRSDRYWELVEARRQYVEAFWRTFSERRLDVLLTPPHAIPAPPHGIGIHLLPAASYAYLFNLLGGPVGVVAATRVAPGEESDRAVGSDRLERFAAESEQGSAGLPVGVQVAGRPWREDQVLAVMAALEDDFRRRPGYPAEPPNFAGRSGPNSP